MRHVPSVDIAGLAFVLAVAMLLGPTSPARAQRAEATHSWQKKDVVIAYGVAKVGKHTLDELAYPGTWRMGNNTASTLRTETPIVSGDAIVPPGSYRVVIARHQEKLFTLVVEGAGFISSPSDSRTQMPGEFAQAPKANDKLIVELLKAGEVKEKSPNEPVDLRVQFGPNQLTVPMVLLGSRSADGAGFGVDAFSVPADVVEKRRSAGSLTPVATFRPKSRKDKKAPATFNLYVGKDTATIAPAGEAPTDSFGFGEVKPPDPAFTRQGTAKWGDAQAEQPYFTIDKIERTSDKQILVLATCGKKTVEVVVPDPLAAPPPSRQ